MSIPPFNPLAYEGTSQPTPYFLSTTQLGPLSTNYKFSVPTIWVNTNISSESPYIYPNAYILLSKPDNVANWVQFAGAYGSATEFAVPSGTTPIYPLDGVITLEAGDGITITGSTTDLPHTITIASSSSGYTWNDVTTDSVTLAAENIYLVDNGSTEVTFALPSSASLGDSFSIVGYSSGKWIVTTSGTQTIIFGSVTASTSLAATEESDVVDISCIVAGTTAAVFKVMGSTGNLTVI